MPRSIIHVSHRLTLATRVTMRALRLRRFAWVLMKDRSIRDRLGLDVWGHILIWALAWRTGGNRAPPMPI